MEYLAGVDMSTRWDYYIANKDGKQLAELTRNVEGLGVSLPACPLTKSACGADLFPSCVAFNP